VGGRAKWIPPSTVKQYLAGLPSDRRKAIAEVRANILANLPKGYQETMSFGMIAYVIPLKRYPETYNGEPLMCAALASQKNHMAVYLCNVYTNPKIETWFKKAYQKTGKRSDMGKSCVRFKQLEDLPVDLIGQTIAKTTVEQFIKFYEDSRKR
jgi:uncharacterized protein YdhG (YjbR/CyaY superfamily)